MHLHRVHRVCAVRVPPSIICCCPDTLAAPHVRSLFRIMSWHYHYLSQQHTTNHRVMIPLFLCLVFFFVPKFLLLYVRVAWLLVIFNAVDRFCIEKVITFPFNFHFFHIFCECHKHILWLTRKKLNIPTIFFISHGEIMFNIRMKQVAIKWSEKFDKEVINGAN